MRANGEARVAREDLPAHGGPALVVSCDMPSCGRAAVLDPRPLFGPRRGWPTPGRSTRFRCRQGGGRLAHVAYPGRAVERYGPIDQASLSLWY